jgi:excisionase family DNA binding protein
MTNSRNGAGWSERLLSIGEVAEYCAVSDKTVRRWIDRKQLRAHHLGRQWRIASEDLESFLLTRASWRRPFVS